MTFFDFHTHRPPLSDVIALVSGRGRPEGKWFSVQCLPDEYDGTPPDLAGAAALGEVGLDRRSGIPVERQCAILETLLESAENLPAVIHCVRAYPELNRELRGFANPVLLHRFAGSPEELEYQLGRGRFISQSLHEIRNRPDILAAFRDRPEHLALLALESDDEIVDYTELYGAAACLLNMDMEQLTAVMELNFKRFLNIEHF